MSERRHYVSFQKIDQAGKEGALMVRLALAVNNFVSGGHLLRYAKNLKSDDKTFEMGYGLTLFLLTGQAGYLSEAMLLIENGKNKNNLELTLKNAPTLKRY